MLSVAPLPSTIMMLAPEMVSSFEPALYASGVVLVSRAVTRVLSDESVMPNWAWAVGLVAKPRPPSSTAKQIAQVALRRRWVALTRIIHTLAEPNAS